MALQEYEKTWRLSDCMQGDSERLKLYIAGTDEVAGLGICVTQVRDEMLVTLLAYYSSKNPSLETIDVIVTKAVALRAAMDELFGAANILGPTREELAEDLVEQSMQAAAE